MARTTDYSASMSELADAPVREQAIHWWILLNSDDATPADQRAFGEWMMRSPERIAAYLDVARLEFGLKSGAVEWPGTTVETLIRDAREQADDNVVALAPHTAAAESLTEDEAPVRPASPLRWVWRTAAVVLLGLFSITWQQPSLPKLIYATEIGEQRSVRLDDGSLVTLNTDSTIEVAFTRDRRLVRLPKGEALFAVSHDPQRPFEVQVGDVKFRAIGTQFNVDRREDHTAVTVVEGKVALVPVQAGAGSASRDSSMHAHDIEAVLSAADRIVIGANGERSLSRLENPGLATSWLKRQLVFNERPLREIAAELNRYNRERIVIQDEELAEQTVTGVIQLHAPGAFVEFVSGIPGVSSAQSSDGTFVISAAPMRQSP
jgi:transmembrane sensor